MSAVLSCKNPSMLSHPQQVFHLQNFVYPSDMAPKSQCGYQIQHIVVESRKFCSPRMCVCGKVLSANKSGNLKLFILNYK